MPNREKLFSQAEVPDWPDLISNIKSPPRMNLGETSRSTKK